RREDPVWPGSRGGGGVLGRRRRTPGQRFPVPGASLGRWGARSSFSCARCATRHTWRTDIDFLCQVCRVAVDAGATVLNLPDTVGYAVPEEYGAMFTKVREYLGDPQGVTLSAHCHDDLGMAVANSLAAIRAGVRQIECTINGIGERAGNASLEEVVVALAVRQDSFGVTTNVRLDQLFPASRLLT